MFPTKVDVGFTAAQNAIRLCGSLLSTVEAFAVQLAATVAEERDFADELTHEEGSLFDPEDETELASQNSTEQLPLASSDVGATA